MATVTLRFKAASLDVDVSTKAIIGLRIEYDLTAGGVTSPGIWSGAPSPELAADLWGLLRRYLGQMATSAGIPPPLPPLPGNPD